MEGNPAKVPIYPGRRIRSYMTLKMNIFFVVLAAGSILAAGCISPQVSPGISPQVSPTPPVPQGTPVPTTGPAAPLPATTVAIFTRDQVSTLFIDIAFGCDTTRVNKFSPSSDNHMFYSLEGEVGNGDILFIKNFTKNYNILMSVEAFSDDPLSSQGNPIVIYPLNSLDSLEKSFIACQELDQKSGEPLYIIYKPVIEQPNGRKEVLTKIYLNSDLRGAQRNHYLERAMLHYLGFPGQTYSYPDSVFFYNTQSNVDLSTIDVEAVRTMYNPGIYQGMTVDEVRRLLLND
jgi:hypothetical protein